MLAVEIHLNLLIVTTHHLALFEKARYPAETKHSHLFPCAKRSRLATFFAPRTSDPSLSPPLPFARDKDSASAQRLKTAKCNNTSLTSILTHSQPYEGENIA
jgi:hypothetical protein